LTWSYSRRVKVQVQTVKQLATCGTPTSCDTAFQQVTINPSGSTGWHTHPRATFVAIAQGEGTLYNAGGTGCTGEKYAANSGFFQTEADNHVLRNEGTTPLVLYAFYLLPSGTPNTSIRTDQAQPANCPTISVSPSMGASNTIGRPLVALSRGRHRVFGPNS